MTTWLKAGLGVGLAVAFIGLFLAAGGSQVPFWANTPRTPTPQAVERGNYGRYLYGITNLSSGDKKIAQFDPTLPNDDSQVIGALKQLAKDGYSIKIADDVQPAVETINETNFITFTVGKDKLLFELFRNSSGVVGTVRFWKETLQ